MGRRIGIKDVAIAAGVSQTTVSQVLGNGKRHVRPETRDNIARVAMELGYRPNAVARGLAKQCMNTIGIVIHHTTLSSNTNPTLTEILDGILAVTTRRQQHANIITFSNWPDDDGFVSSLTDGRCDGILLVVPPDNSNPALRLRQLGIPVVQIGVNSMDGAVSSVDVDNVKASESISQYLISQGHRSIAFYCDIPFTHQFIDLRLEGLKLAISTSGENVALHDFTYSTIEIVIAGIKAMEPTKRPTAVLCATDLCAFQMLSAMELENIQVPQDISVAGFDDIFRSRLTSPPLTTVKMPFACLGERAAELLLDHINSDSLQQKQVLLQFELIVRESVGKPGNFQGAGSLNTD